MPVFHVVTVKVTGCDLCHPTCRLCHVPGTAGARLNKFCFKCMVCRYCARYGTGPLRRYVDILAQRQIAAVLRGTGYLGKKYLMDTVSRESSAGVVGVVMLAVRVLVMMLAVVLVVWLAVVVVILIVLAFALYV